MPSTRSSTRQGSSSASGQATSTKDAAGTKRAAEGETSEAKRGKKADVKEKEQKTLEETMPSEDTEPAKVDQKQDYGEDAKVEDPSDKMKDDPKRQGMEAPKTEDQPFQSEDKPKSEGGATNGSAIVEDTEREQAMPSNILEKGIIYFFFRARVNVDEPHGVEDIARSYMVLRPLPLGAKLGEGPLEDKGNNRLLALPKKVLPVDHRDRFMVFVEKARTTLKELKDSFIEGSEYATKTAGTRHTPAATPSGEGVYAITTTGRESHLSYILTVPTQINEVQEELGLRQRASFVVSAKNPQVGGPANTNLPKSPEFDQDILDEFHGRGWMPLQARLLDYDNAQMILIGERTGDITKALEPTQKDEKHHKETPIEEMEKLEHEDGIRIHHLKGDDPVLEDLGISSQDHAKLQTTW